MGFVCYLLFVFWSFSGASAEGLSFVPKGETKPEPYLIETPKSIEPGKRHPLIVWLHGRGGDHKSQWRLKEFAQLRKRAAERGYSVLCPHLGLTIG